MGHITCSLVKTKYLGGHNCWAQAYIDPHSDAALLNKTRKISWPLFDQDESCLVFRTKGFIWLGSNRGSLIDVFRPEFVSCCLVCALGKTLARLWMCCENQSTLSLVRIRSETGPVFTSACGGQSWSSVLISGYEDLKFIPSHIGWKCVPGQVKKCGTQNADLYILQFLDR